MDQNLLFQSAFRIYMAYRDAENDIVPSPQEYCQELMERISNFLDLTHESYRDGKLRAIERLAPRLIRLVEEYQSDVKLEELLEFVAEGPLIASNLVRNHQEIIRERIDRAIAVSIQHVEPPGKEDEERPYHELIREYLQKAKNQSERELLESLRKRVEGIEFYIGEWKPEEMVRQILEEISIPAK